jgi:hypothetical protein
MLGGGFGGADAGDYAVSGAETDYGDFGGDVGDLGGGDFGGGDFGDGGGGDF